MISLGAGGPRGGPWPWWWGIPPRVALGTQPGGWWGTLGTQPGGPPGGALVQVMMGGPGPALVPPLGKQPESGAHWGAGFRKNGTEPPPGEAPRTPREPCCLIYS